MSTAKRRARSRGARRRVARQWPHRNVVAGWLRGALAVAALAALVLGAETLLSAALGLPVERIVVSGRLEQLREAEVRSVVSEDLDRGFIGLDLDAVRSRLEALPWVYQARVRRRWPGTVAISVIEQLPIARWGNSGFLNHEAEIFRSSNAEQWRGLPLIHGKPGSEARLMRRFEDLSRALAPAGLAIEQLEEDPAGQIDLRLTGGVLLRLGDRDIEDRVARFLALRAAELRAYGDRVVRVDMRYEQGAAVAFVEQEQVAGVTGDRL